MLGKNGQLPLSVPSFSLRIAPDLWTTEAAGKVQRQKKPRGHWKSPNMESRGAAQQARPVGKRCDGIKKEQISKSNQFGILAAGLRETGMQTASNSNLKPQLKQADGENIMTGWCKHHLDIGNNELKTCVREAASLQMHKGRQFFSSPAEEKKPTEMKAIIFEKELHKNQCSSKRKELKSWKHFQESTYRYYRKAAGHLYHQVKTLQMNSNNKSWISLCWWGYTAD